MFGKQYLCQYGRALYEISPQNFGVFSAYIENISAYELTCSYLQQWTLSGPKLYRFQTSRSWLDFVF